MRNLDKLPDSELMRLVRNKDQEAFTELYNRYSAKLYNFFLRMLDKDEAKAQDFTHDLFLTIIEQPERFDLQRRFDTWFFHLAYNMCKNEYRRMTVRSDYRRNAVTQEPFTSETAGHGHDRRVFTAALDAHLEKLDELHKSVFLLRYQQELPLYEISKILDCPEGTVKSRLFNAIRKLAVRLRVFDPKLN